MHPAPHVHPWPPRLTLVLLALGCGCHATRIQDASRHSPVPVPPASRLLVLVEARPGTFRGALEDALATELRRRGVTAETSIGRLQLESFQADPAGVAAAWSARTHDSLLVLRPVVGATRLDNKDQPGRYGSFEPRLPTTVIKARERTVGDTMIMHESAGSRIEPVVADVAMVEEQRVSEVAFLDPGTGQAVWTARVQSTVREGQDETRWMADLARVVVRRLRQEKLVP